MSSVLNRLRQVDEQPGAAQAETRKVAQPAAPGDCLECRLVGGGSMLALSAYFMVQVKAMPTSISPAHRRLHVVLSAAFAAAGVARVLL